MPIPACGYVPIHNEVTERSVERATCRQVAADVRDRPAYREPMLLAEDLLLLLTDDESGITRAASLALGLGGAVLADLLAARAVVAEGTDSFWHRRAFHAAPTDRPADPVLAEALDLIARKPRSGADLVPRLGKPLAPVLRERLAAQGLLAPREHRVLGIFPTTRWPASDLRYEQGLRQHLVGVLTGSRAPDPRAATLLAVLAAMGELRALGETSLNGRELKTSAKRFLDDDLAAQAVKAAVAAAQAATAGAVTAATIVTTS